MKKVSFGSKPTPGQRAAADDWVMDRDRPDETLKRLTIDIPLSLHRRVKTQCAMENLRMADVVRDFLQERSPLAAERRPPMPVSLNTETQKHGES